MAVYYFRRLYTTFDLYIAFDGYILLLALPCCDFVAIQGFITILRTYGLKARLDFNISLLVLTSFAFSVVQWYLL